MPCLKKLFECSEVPLHQTGTVGIVWSLLKVRVMIIDYRTGIAIAVDYILVDSNTKTSAVSKLNAMLLRHKYAHSLEIACNSAERTGWVLVDTGSQHSTLLPSKTTTKFMYELSAFTGRKV